MDVTTFAGNLSLWEMVAGAGPMVKLVLLTLLAFSVLSWAIIIYKILLLRKAESETSAFYDIFWNRGQFSQVLAESKAFTSTPLTKLFTSAYGELSAAGQRDRLGKDDMERIERVLRRTSSTEASRLEYAVSFLATTGNTAPFIGLFGTVWGIMASFRNIGALGSANLAVVAPGISEALVATAMGLLVAIPAVVAYNYILARITRIQSEMDNFSSDLINILEKQLTAKTRGE